MPSSDLFLDPLPSLDGERAFLLYEAVKHRLPHASHPAKADRYSGLLDVADQVDVFVFDAFGVLNVGTDPIPGANTCVAALRGLGKKLFVLTNAASFNREQTFDKFNGLGFDFAHEELITSRHAAEINLAEFGGNHHWGVAATSDFSPNDLTVSSVSLEDKKSDYDEATAFLFLSAQNWNADRQLMLEQSLREKPRPVVVANPDIVAPRGTEFSIEPGYFGHRLEQMHDVPVNFHGKPFPSVYDVVEQRLEGQGIDPARICMVGDTLHTDVRGGAARGWKTALVTDHGLFKGLDPDHYINISGIRPDWMVPAI